MVDAQPTNALETQIDQMIAQLASKSAAKRREAALFLGEAAAADAVAPLVEVYEKDKNASVRAAAAYSLGMYKAVEQALKRGDEDHVVSLLHEIEDKGNIGRRAPVGRTVKIALGLLVSLIVLLGLYLYRADLKALAFGSTKPRAAVVGEVQQAYEMVKNDTRTLQTELLNVISNRPLSCIAFFNNPAPYSLNPVDARTFPDIAQIADQLNTAQTSLAAAKARYDAACNNGATFGATEAQQTFQILLPGLQVLDPMELELTQAEAQVQATPIPPTAQPTVQPTINSASAGASAAPTTASGGAQAGVPLQPTVPPEQIAGANPKIHLPALFNILDDVTSPRGASTLLVQYWSDVQTTGSTTGCEIASPPDIPDNNVFIPDVDYKASPDLNEAVQLINSGLAALHTGWVNFRFACNSRNLGQVVATRLQEARVAASAFQAAQVKLTDIQNSP